MTRNAPLPKPEPKQRPKMFRSGITGALFVPKQLQTPERFFDVNLDNHIKAVWIEVYIEVIKTKTRNEARMIADEAIEDYLEKFDVI